MKLHYDFMLRGREIIFLPPDVKRDTAVYSTGAKLINQWNIKIYTQIYPCKNIDSLQNIVNVNLLKETSDPITK